MENIYYVYEWIRLDTNEPFYIGKGKDNRCYHLTRGNNHHFNNIVKSIPCVVNILHDNLEEETAYGLECYYIWLYRDVIGYDLTNMTDGGEGVTLCGKNSPWYGKHHTEETKYKMSKKAIGRKITDECKYKISNKAKERLKNKENHSMYGKRHTEEAIEKMRKVKIGKKASSETKEKISKATSGKNNPRAKSVICLTTKRIFFTSKDGARYYGIKNLGDIGQCCKGKYKTCGKLPDGTPLKWKYLVWNHGKKFRVKEVVR